MAHNNGQTALITSDISTIVPQNDESLNHDRFDMKNFDRLAARSVPISALSPGLYLRRTGTNAAHVQLLIDAGATAELPPILVQESGWRIIDGLHRLEAAKLRGEQTIRARFIDCTDGEALVLAIKANTSHGLPLSKADRISGAKRVLAAHPDWSDRAISGMTGLSPKTIASLRNRSGNAPHHSVKRLGRDGRRRPVSADEGRRRAAEYITAHPNAPLRQVAREADVSLGTVHDVSTRLRRGISPDRNGRWAAAKRLTAHQTETPAPQTETPAPQTETPAPQTETAHETETPAQDNTVTALPVGSPPPRRNHIEVPPNWAGTAAKLANDPTIRYTEGGKEFLRWMALHATHPDGWREFIGAIPVHWLSVMAPIADNISREWGMFAERLRNKQETSR